MEFTRRIEKDLLDRLDRSNKVIVLTGPRQVGKTTLAKAIIRRHNSVIFIDADLRPIPTALTNKNLTDLKLLLEGYSLIVLDEAQRIDDVGQTLKIVHDHLPHMRVLATGSSSLDLSKATGEPLTGRMWQYELYPMAISELTHLGNAYEIGLHLESFILYGLYPEVFHYTSASDKQEYLTTLTRAYLYKDILELSGIRHHDKIHDLLVLLAYQIGSSVSYSELGKKLRLSTETVQHYIDLLEKSYVIRRLRGFSRNLRKEVTKNSKIYFVDLGVRNAVIQDFKPIALRPDRGALWENFLFMERLKYNRYRKHHVSSYFWRTYTGAELDYLEIRGHDMSAYEFKWGDKQVKQPKTWRDTYPDSTYATINGSNFHAFVGLA